MGGLGGVRHQGVEAGGAAEALAQIRQQGAALGHAAAQISHQAVDVILVPGQDPVEAIDEAIHRHQQIAEIHPVLPREHVVHLPHDAARLGHELIQPRRI